MLQSQFMSMLGDGFASVIKFSEILWSQSTCLSSDIFSYCSVTYRRNGSTTPERNRCNYDAMLHPPGCPCARFIKGHDSTEAHAITPTKWAIDEATVKQYIMAFLKQTTMYTNRFHAVSKVFAQLSDEGGNIMPAATTKRKIQTLFRRGEQ